MTGSGKCDVEATARKGDFVWGVLFELDAADKPTLDRAEGLGNGYVEQRVEIATDRGSVKALAYIATAKDSSVRPYHWYKALVIAGAREHGLPREYVQLLEDVPSVADPDHERAASNERLLTAS